MFNIFVKQGKLLVIILILSIVNVYIKPSSIINWAMVILSLLLLGKTLQINIHVKKAKAASANATLYLVYPASKWLYFKNIPNFYTLKSNRLITVNQTPRTSIKLTDEDIQLVDDYIKNMLTDKHYYKKVLNISLDNLIVEKMS